MAISKKTSIKVRTTASRGEHDGILFYILPPLLLAAIFAFCAMANDKEVEADSEPAYEYSEDE